MGFDGISLLSNLQALGLEAIGEFMLHPETGALTKLTTLYLDATAVYIYDKGFMDISLNWQSLLALQRLSVLSYFPCDESMFGLAELKHLDTEQFVEAAPLDLVSRDCLVTLKQRLNCRLLQPNNCLQQSSRIKAWFFGHVGDSYTSKTTRLETLVPEQCGLCMHIHPTADWPVLFRTSMSQGTRKHVSHWP